MPADGQGQNSRAARTEKMDYQELVRQVAQRVWEMWREELRRNRERRGGQRRG